MEHRIGTRKPVSNLFVTLSQRGVVLGSYPVHDIGSGGLAISGKIASLALHSLVTVKMRFNEMEANGSVEIKALVVHFNNMLTGLMWAEHVPHPMVAIRAQPESAASIRASM